MTETQPTYNVPRTTPVDPELSSKLHDIASTARAAGADKAYIVRDQAVTLFGGTSRPLVSSYHPVVVIITFPVSDTPRREPGIERVYC